MIFVTVGTHEQPFDRLVKKIDELVEIDEIKEEVIIQTGFCTYRPKHCTWQKLYPYKEMDRLVKEARIVITHGGPASFVAPLRIGKTPIVVPRQYKFNEHVNDHQLIFAVEVQKRLGSIITIVDIEELGGVIKNYDEIIKNLNTGNVSNNAKFNEDLEKIVDEMFDR